ncbi:hypothetical protein C8R46DRAFT_883813 [Mycena filopes]|nr:hypothetical protein C8R46DRAFT_883813 [Mycena filopes]
MRQLQQTEQDDKLRQALINMRYAACTDADLDFLDSRIAGFRPGNPKLNRQCVRNVSIITARNSQKDALNQMGAERFAKDNGQTLVHFHSVDRVSARSPDKGKWKGCLQSEIKRMTGSLQRKLWEAMPSTTSEYIPGKLSLCVGMPIMLRANDATELCITKGQEAVVVGWHSSVGPAGKDILETLFVKLSDPPKTIQIGDLPENVVPLVRTATPVTVLLEDDTLLSILREQVICLLNFGMTDYTSQGKSRAQNPVELANCRSHMSYYVALSRGFTAEGTIIIQGFDSKKITGGMSGFLRQELRELEILDEITRLRYEGLLPRSVAGLYRRGLLRSYYAWKKDSRDPPHFHAAMKWNSSMGPRIPEPVVYGEWRSSDTRRSLKRKATQDAQPTPVERYAVYPDPEERAVKRLKLDVLVRAAPHLVPQIRKPVGLIWDSRDYSCAYDATFTILGNLWVEAPIVWSGYFGHLSGGLGEFGTLLQSVVDGRMPFERARDIVRRGMNARKPDYFPYGHNSTSVDRVAQILLPSKFYAVGRQSCSTCGYVDPVSYGMLESYLSAGLSTTREYPNGVELRSWISDYLTTGRRSCPTCSIRGVRSRFTMRTVVRDVPPIMLLDLSHDKLLFSNELAFQVNGVEVKMKLRGVIYGGQGHFTCRVVQRDRTMWFHDGITTGSSCLRETNLQDVDDRLRLHKCGEKIAVAVVYARVID